MRRAARAGGVGAGCRGGGGGGGTFVGYSALSLSLYPALRPPGASAFPSSPLTGRTAPLSFTQVKAMHAVVEKSLFVTDQVSAREVCNQRGCREVCLLCS